MATQRSVTNEECEINVSSVVITIAHLYESLYIGKYVDGM